MTQQPSADLMAALGFTEQDLTANREDHLSDAQEARLRRGWRRTLLIGIGLLIAGIFGATLLLFLGQQNQSPVLTIMGLAVTVLNALLVGIGAQHAIRYRTDVDSGRVERLSGPVTHTVRVYSGRAAAYVLKIGGQDVVVTKPVFHAFVENGRYTLYRSAGSRALLSAEPMTP
jgi:hypothetical protein